MSGASSLHAGAGRAERLAGELRDQGVDVLIVTTPIDVRYLTGFTGGDGDGLALIAAGGDRGKAGADTFLTDFRYLTQSAEQVPETFSREIVTGSLIEAAATSLGDAGGRLGFDDTSLTVSQHSRLHELLGQTWELIACPGAVARLRAVKDADELAYIHAACELADEAMRGLLEDGLVDRTEREVAIELELRMRRLGAEGASFPSIVAAGAHGALPHAEPRGERIPPDSLVTIDWGAVHEGYCSDCTRTYATGEGISDEAREIYELVLRAQERGVAAVMAGPTGREVDAVAREVIAQGGQGENFGHGLGHGVGLEIHEAPRLSRTAGDEPLRQGNVVTVEPGIYLPGRLGVRIEDLVVVTEDGCEVLTGLSKALTVVS